MMASLRYYKKVLWVFLCIDCTYMLTMSCSRLEGFNCPGTEVTAPTFLFAIPSHTVTYMYFSSSSPLLSFSFAVLSRLYRLYHIIVHAFGEYGSLEK